MAQGDYYQQKELLDINRDIDELNFKKEEWSAKLKFILIGIVSLSIIFILLVTKSNDPVLREDYKPAIAVIIIIAGIAAYYLYYLIDHQKKQLEMDIRSLIERRRVLTQEPQEGVKKTIPYYDRLVEINLDNLEKYYKLIKVHAENSFKVSLFSGVIGFILISVGLVIGYLDQKNLNILYISTASGILIEFISGIFFYLYNKTIRELKDYHERLLQVQNILLAFKIVDDTKDEQKKVTMLEQMLTCLIKK